MNGEGEFRVWDLPVRIFHWLLVLLVLLQYLSGEYELLSMDWHVWLGQVTLALLLFRVSWGFFGSDNARFSRFLVGPRRILAYIASLRAPAHDEGVTHNALGGWSVLAMLVALLVQAVTGLFSSDDIEVMGPLADKVSTRTSSWFTDIHEVNRHVVLALIALHLSALAWHWFARRDNLVPPMVTGRKRLSSDPGLRFASLWRAALLALASAGIVYGLRFL